MDEKNIILDMRGITKIFPGVKALDSVSLQLEKGEVHALIGENGAGKSTLMKTLLGMYQPDSGEIIYKGEKVNFKSPVDALNKGISMIHQEISLVFSTSVSENIWIGREDRFSKFGLISSKKRTQATKELLDKLEIHLDPNEIVQNLTVANMQLVEIARSISYNSDIIIMDEPTSALSNTEIDILYKIVRSLVEEGITIVFISHKLEEIFQICDRITVFRDGKYISTHESEKITKQELIALIAGRELTELFPKAEAEITDIVLEVKNLNAGKRISDVSFKVRRGEILGFCGLMGAGRTEIMQAVFGIDKYDSGEIQIDGKKVQIRSPKQAVDNGIAMVTEDRLRKGVIGNLSVKMNLTIAYLSRICNKLQFINFKAENEQSEEIARKLNVKASNLMQAVGSLSGGNQQKVIIARWLLTNPKVLILDEPTRGIDVGSKSEIHKLISQLAQKGMAIIMVSSELPEILGMSDRIIVVNGGRIVSEYMRNEADQETLMQDAFG